MAFEETGEFDGRTPFTITKNADGTFTVPASLYEKLPDLKVTQSADGSLTVEHAYRDMEVRITAPDVYAKECKFEFDKNYDDGVILTDGEEHIKAAIIKALEAMNDQSMQAAVIDRSDDAVANQLCYVISKIEEKGIDAERVIKIGAGSYGSQLSGFRVRQNDTVLELEYSGTEATFLKYQLKCDLTDKIIRLELISGDIGHNITDAVLNNVTHYIDAAITANIENNEIILQSTLDHDHKKRVIDTAISRLSSDELHVTMEDNTLENYALHWYIEDQIKGSGDGSYDVYGHIDVEKQGLSDTYGLREDESLLFYFGAKRMFESFMLNGTTWYVYNEQFWSETYLKKIGIFDGYLERNNIYRFLDVPNWHPAALYCWDHIEDYDSLPGTKRMLANGCNLPNRIDIDYKNDYKSSSYYENGHFLTKYRAVLENALSILPLTFIEIPRKCDDSYYYDAILDLILMLDVDAQFEDAWYTDGTACLQDVGDNDYTGTVAKAEKIISVAKRYEKQVVLVNIPMYAGVERAALEYEQFTHVGYGTVDEIDFNAYGGYMKYKYDNGDPLSLQWLFDEGYLKGVYEPDYVNLSVGGRTLDRDRDFLQSVCSAINTAMGITLDKTVLYYRWGLLSNGECNETLVAQSEQPSRTSVASALYNNGEYIFTQSYPYQLTQRQLVFLTITANIKSGTAVGDYIENGTEIPDHRDPCDPAEYSEETNTLAYTDNSGSNHQITKRVGVYANSIEADRTVPAPEPTNDPTVTYNITKNADGTLTINYTNNSIGTTNEVNPVYGKAGVKKTHLKKEV